MPNNKQNNPSKPPSKSDVTKAAVRQDSVNKSPKVHRRARKHKDKFSGELKKTDKMKHSHKKIKMKSATATADAVSIGDSAANESGLTDGATQDSMSMSWESEDDAFNTLTPAAEPATSNVQMDESMSMTRTIHSSTVQQTPEPREGMATLCQWHKRRVRRALARATTVLLSLRSGILTVYHVQKGKQKNREIEVIDLNIERLFFKHRKLIIGLFSHRRLFTVKQKDDFVAWRLALLLHKKWRKDNPMDKTENLPNIKLNTTDTNTIDAVQPEIEHRELSDLETIDSEMAIAKRNLQASAAQMQNLNDSRQILRQVTEKMQDNRVKTALIHFELAMVDADDAQKALRKAYLSMSRMKRAIKHAFFKVNRQQNNFKFDDAKNICEERERPKRHIAVCDDESITASSDEDLGETADNAHHASIARALARLDATQATPVEQPLPTNVVQTPPPSPQNNRETQNQSTVPGNLPSPVSPFVQHRSKNEDDTKPANEEPIKIVRRTTLPAKAEPVPSGMALVKNFVMTGTIPLTMYMPINMLQLLCLELEYSHLLDAAAADTDSLERVCNVIGFAISAYVGCAHRTRKPFNPCLGETFEFDRWNDLGWRFMGEQVDHTPDVSACAAQGKAGWQWNMVAFIPRPPKSLFARNIEFPVKVPPSGTRVSFNNLSEEYRWNRPISCIVEGKSPDRFLTNYGDVQFNCMSNGMERYRAYIKFDKTKATSFNNDERKVSGQIFEMVNGKESRTPIAKIEGNWSNGQGVYRELGNGHRRQLFKPLYQENLRYNSEYFGFDDMCFQLNEITPDFQQARPAKTDVRFRPDQRFVELGEIEKAISAKNAIEERQRSKRRDVLAQKQQHRPLWFTPTIKMGKWHPPTLPEATAIHQNADRLYSTVKNVAAEAKWWEYNNRYWSAKTSKFANIPLPDLWDEPAT